MQLSLDLPERIGMIILLADVKAGPREFMNLIKKTRDTVEIKEEEVAEYGITGRKEGGLDWQKSTANIAKDFDITDTAFNYLKTTLERFDKEKKITVDLLAIANKILGEEEKKD